MYMTDEEICRHYRLSADKRDAIQVLADLNATDRYSIREVLGRAGLTKPLKPRVEKNLPKNNAEMARQIDRMLREGMTQYDIADTLGCTRETVKRHAKQLGFESKNERRKRK